MDHIYKNIEQYNPNKKQKILITFYDMIADMLNNKKLNLIVTELFIRGRKLNISLVFITRSFLLCQKILDLILRTISLWKFQTNEIFNKLYLIIHQMLNLKTLWIFIKKMYCKTMFFSSYWCYFCIR